MQTFEGVSSTLDDIAGIIGSCTIYEKIYSSSELESAKAVVVQLPRLYSFCLVFMARAIDYYHTKAPSTFSYLLAILNDIMADIENRKGSWRHY